MFLFIFKVESLSCWFAGQTAPNIGIISGWVGLPVPFAELATKTVPAVFTDWRGWPELYSVLDSLGITISTFI